VAKRKKTLRVGVVGLGMGRSHIRCYAASGCAEVVAICDVDADRLLKVGDEFGVEKRYGDFDAMLRAEELDAVSVVLPNALHEPFTVKALKRRLHVLCEKPMAHNLASARRMAAAARRSRRLLAINFSYRATPAAKWLRAAVDRGRLGRIYFARTGWHRRRGMPGFGGWFGNKKLAGGGPLIDLGVHRLDLAWWLMGRPEPVSASGATYAEIAPRIARRRRKVFTTEDMATGYIRFKNGATVVVEASWAANTEKREDMFTQLYGTKGGAVQRNFTEGYDFESLIFTELGGQQVDVKAKLPAKTPDSESSIANFARAALAGRTTAEGDWRDGLAVQRMLEGVYKSARLGREVRL
jgi:predicted dehydrogenase